MIEKEGKQEHHKMLNGKRRRGVKSGHGDTKNKGHLKSMFATNTKYNLKPVANTKCKLK